MTSYFQQQNLYLSAELGFQQQSLVWLTTFRALFDCTSSIVMGSTRRQIKAPPSGGRGASSAAVEGGGAGGGSSEHPLPPSGMISPSPTAPSASLAAVSESLAPQRVLKVLVAKHIAKDEAAGSTGYKFRMPSRPLISSFPSMAEMSKYKPTICHIYRI